MTESLRIACQQHIPTPNDVAASIARIAQAAKHAADKGCQLLVLPEASVTGYNIDLDTAQHAAETADGAAADSIAGICQQHQIAIAYGFIERTPHALYNSVQLIDSQGQRVALYHKTHLWGDLDRRLFSAGDDLVPLVEIGGWHIGLLICYDIEFPETARRLALEGAELLLIPTALMKPFTTVAKQVVPVRAYENQLFIAYTNYCGNENGLDYIGHSCIVGPDGEDCARAAEQPTTLYAELQRSAIQRSRNELPYHHDRRPAIYRALAETST